MPLPLLACIHPSHCSHSAGAGGRAAAADDAEEAAAAAGMQQQAGVGQGWGPCRQAWRAGYAADAAGLARRRRVGRAYPQAWGHRWAARRRQQHGGRSGTASSGQRCSSGRLWPWRCAGSG